MSPAWTRETINAVRLADRRYVFAWNKVLRAYGAPTLAQAMARYNADMADVMAVWKAEIKAALALSEPF